MNKKENLFKATTKELNSSTSMAGFVTYKDSQLIKINTEYLNPLRREGYATVFIQVDEERFKRCFELKSSDLHIINFISKFVNDCNYRKKYMIE